MSQIAKESCPLILPLLSPFSWFSSVQFSLCSSSMFLSCSLLPSIKMSSILKLSYKACLVWCLLISVTLLSFFLLLLFPPLQEKNKQTKSPIRIGTESLHLPMLCLHFQPLEYSLPFVLNTLSHYAFSILWLIPIHLLSLGLNVTSSKSFSWPSKSWLDILHRSFVHAVFPPPYSIQHI